MRPPCGKHKTRSRSLPILKICTTSTQFVTTSLTYCEYFYLTLLQLIKLAANIYFQYLFFFNCSGSQGCWSLSSHCQVKEGYTLDCLCHTQTDNHSHLHSWQRDNLAVKWLNMSLDCGRKPEYPENPPTHARGDEEPRLSHCGCWPLWSSGCKNT